MKEIKRIFCNPRSSKDEFFVNFGEGYSSLYLLRRDVFWCRGIDSKTNAKITEQAGAPFAAFILIRLLFNYLVFISGLNYQNYIKKFFDTALSNEELEILNHLRNALEHQSYGLVWEPDKKRGEKGKTTYFAMTEEIGSPLAEKIDETQTDETWVVNIDLLHKAIEKSACNLYESSTKTTAFAQDILTRTKNHDMHVVSKTEFINYSKAKSQGLSKPMK